MRNLLRCVKVEHHECPSCVRLVVNATGAAKRRDAMRIRTAAPPMRLDASNPADPPRAARQRRTSRATPPRVSRSSRSPVSPLRSPRRRTMPRPHRVPSTRRQNRSRVRDARNVSHRCHAISQRASLHRMVGFYKRRIAADLPLVREYPVFRRGQKYKLSGNGHPLIRCNTAQCHTWAS